MFFYDHRKMTLIVFYIIYIEANLYYADKRNMVNYEIASLVLWYILIKTQNHVIGCCHNQTYLSTLVHPSTSHVKGKINLYVYK